MSTEKKMADALRDLAQLAYTQNGNRHDDVTQMIASAREALAAYDNAPPGFTVCLQEVGNTETTYVVYASGDRYDAVQAAKRECLADWNMPDDTDLHVLAVFAGDVEVLEWEDQA